VAVVSLYVGRDCHLCEIARAALERLALIEPFTVEEVDITGVPELETAYREWLPVVEVGGERISVYRVEETPLLARLRASPEDVTKSVKSAGL
jgi:hypothetical protein